MESNSYPPNPLPGAATKIVLTPQSAAIELGNNQVQLSASLVDCSGDSV